MKCVYGNVLHSTNDKTAIIFVREGHFELFYENRLYESSSDFQVKIVYNT